MGKAVNLMNSGKFKGVKNTENGAVSTGNGGIPASLKVKAAGTKPASTTNAGLVTPKLAPGEKINNLF